jgi:hypothetical protein
MIGKAILPLPYFIMNLFNYHSLSS